MSKKWYGSLDNRSEENRMFTEVIEVGTPLTEYLWSDRHAYEVVEVTDRKHIKVREYKVKLAGEPFSNKWDYISDPSNPIREMVKRGNYWYWVTDSGKVRTNVSFGVADYYYDYSF